MRTYTVIMATPDFRDRFTVDVKANSSSEAISKAVSQHRYPSGGCSLKRETKADIAKDELRAKTSNRLRKAELKRARMYHRMKKTGASSPLRRSYEMLKKRINKLKREVKELGDF